MVVVLLHPKQTGLKGPTEVVFRLRPKQEGLQGQAERPTESWTEEDGKGAVPDN
jgi:hypothetical protein